jgi:dethiobiotin synthetase
VPALMVQGVSSDAGKSLLVTALCRWAHQQGISVAPFKAQNMSNNARVVDGGEIGTAQWLQAVAAGVLPDVRMNPILLKPESDTRSQVVLNGVVNEAFTSAPWRDRSSRLWPYVTEAFRSLSDEFDVVIIEGGGSPAETNLWSSDIVNMAVADLADAPVALVADIDRGGAFAHLFGTWALLPPGWRRRIEGFVLNKFRGDLERWHLRPTTWRRLPEFPRSACSPGSTTDSPMKRDRPSSPDRGTGRGYPSYAVPMPPTSMSSYSCSRSPESIGCGQLPSSLTPTSSFFRGPSTSPTTSPGFATLASPMPFPKQQETGLQCSESAGDFRCWGSGSRTLTGWRERQRALVFSPW